MTANLKELRLLCENNEHFGEITQIIESLHDRQDYARYHYQEYKRLSDEKKSQLEAIRSALVLDADCIQYRVAIKANIIACMQNMHIVHDILGYLIYRVLDLKISNKNIYICTVIKFLKDDRYKTLFKLLVEFAGKDEKNQPLYFRYLCDIVNHSKHKYTIEPKFETSFKNEIERSCYFDNFTHKDKTHEKMDATFFINTEYNRETKLIIQIENELINILKGKLG